MSYETAVRNSLKVCSIKLYRVKGERIGAANDPNAPIYAGFRLRAELTCSRLSKPIDVVIFDLPDSSLDLDKWCRIDHNPALIARAVQQLSNTARTHGCKSVEIVDCSNKTPAIISKRKLS
jgi:hypothetical protein